MSLFQFSDIQNSIIQAQKGTPLLCSESFPVTANYLLAKQHNKPVLPRNQQHPINRMSDRAAVTHNRVRKKLSLRSVA